MTKEQEIQIRDKIRTLSVNELRDCIVGAFSVVNESLERRLHTRLALHWLEKWDFYQFTRSKALDDMTADAQELGLYTEEMNK